jgi:hypothetical protein
MGTTEHPSTESKITAVCTITDPAERQRRLARAYELITEFAREKRRRRGERTAHPRWPGSPDPARPAHGAPDPAAGHG